MKKFNFFICLISITFSVSCSKSAEGFVENKQLVNFKHATDTFETIDSSTNVEWSQTLFNADKDMEFDEIPSTKEIPDNINYQIDNKAPNLFAYYGVFKGYDVFSWDDDNAFGYVVHSFSIDRFVFRSASYHILYSIKHTDEQVPFFTLSEDGNALHYNQAVVTPFVELYANGVFDLQDVGYLYYARNNYLKENSSPYADNSDYYNRFRITSTGKYKIPCPNVDLDHFDTARAIHQRFLFQDKIPFYNYSYVFPKELDKCLKEFSIKYDKNSIFLTAINGYHLFKVDSLDSSKVEQASAPSLNLQNYLSRRYISDLNILNIYGYKEGKLYNLYDLLIGNVLGINSLDKMACQIYTNLCDVYDSENGNSSDFEKDFFDNWKEYYLSIPSL